MPLVPPSGELQTTIDVAGPSGSLSCDSTSGSTTPPVSIRSAYLEVRVPPLLLFLRVLRPLIGDADAAEERHVAVDDQRLAVGPIVRLFDRQAADRVEPANAGTGRLEARDMLRIDLGPHRVEDEAHFGPPPRRRLERRGETPGNFTGAVVDIAFEADAMLCSVDGGEHGGKGGVAVGEHLVGVAGGHRVAEEPRQVLGKAWVVGRE